MFFTIRPYLHLNCVLMQNWIIWNRFFFILKLYLRETELFHIEMIWHLTACEQNLYLY